MKTCTKCKQTKELRCFYNNRTKADGKHSRCKACFSQDCSSYNEKNRESRKRKHTLYNRSEGYCVYKAVYPEGVYVGSGLF